MSNSIIRAADRGFQLGFCPKKRFSLIGLVPLHISNFPPRSSNEYILERVHKRTTLRQHLLSHRNAVYCLQYDQRGEFLFTGSDDYMIKMWSLEPKNKNACTLRHTFRGHLGEIIELAVSPDNHLLASVDSNCCLVLWCLRTGQPVISVRGSSVNRIISGMAFLSVPVVDASEVVMKHGDDSSCQEKPTSKSRSPSGWLAITSFGGFLHLIPYEHRSLSCSEPSADPWSCCSVTLLPTVRFITGVENTHNVFWPSIVCMDISPGALLIATGCSDNCIRLYHFADPQTPQLSTTLRAHEDVVNSVAFSHDGLKLASGSADAGSCWLWRYQAGKWRSMVLAFRKRVKCRPCLLAWSKTDRYLIASMKNGTVYVYFGETGKLATVIDGHEGAVHALSPSPFHDDILATAGVDGRFQLWHLPAHRAMDAGLCGELSQIQPLLSHYRYPPCQLDSEHGIVWQPIEGDSTMDPLPLIYQQSSLPGGRRPGLSRDASSSSTANINTRPMIFSSTIGRDATLQQSGSSRPQHAVGAVAATMTTAAGSQSNQGRIGNTSATGGPFVSSKYQRITACRALPTGEGVGFVVVTKGGLLSIFRPNTDSEADEMVASQDCNSTQPWSGMPTVSSTQYDVCEQFFHWELDTAEWLETPNTSTPQALLMDQLSLVLGSPPASQSVTGLSSGPRFDRNGRTSRPQSLNTSRSPVTVVVPVPATEMPGIDVALPTTPARIYQPPFGVCFQLIHAPSGVPFYRLPPPYLTNLRGGALASTHQRLVPGREHLNRPLDLLPSVAVDEEIGEDVVVDDIQFCPQVPGNYCPIPMQSTTRPIPGKQYLWQSVWTSGNRELVQPLNSSELRVKVERHRERYREELLFFMNHGEARVTFGDEFTESLDSNASSQFVFLQPQHTPSLSSFQSDPSLDPKGAVKFDPDAKSASRMTRSSSSRGQSRGRMQEEKKTGSDDGLSFLHSFLNRKTESQLVTAPTTSQSNDQQILNSEGPSTSTATQAIRSANDLLSPMDYLEDAADEVEDASSESSEWSTHIDVDIGWWHRQRRRQRQRRQPLSSEQHTRPHPISDEANDEAVQSLTTNTNDTENTRRSTGIVSATEEQGPARCRRSLRQLSHRILARRRLVRERRVSSDSRPDRLRHMHGGIRSTSRRQRRRQSVDQSRCRITRALARENSPPPPEAPTIAIHEPPSPQLSLNAVSVSPTSSSSATVCATAPAMDVEDSMDTTVVISDDFIGERRERLKRRLIRSLDFAASPGNRVPLSTCPPNGYEGPECEGQCYTSAYTDASPITTPTLTHPHAWLGPHFDWLSTYHPVATPYVPQLGDRVVYATRGHRDYMHQAWRAGRIPDLSTPACTSVSVEVAGDCLWAAPRGQDLVELPWERYPQIPPYVCGTVRSYVMSIVRINTRQSNTKKTTNSSASSSPPPSSSDRGQPTGRRKRMHSKQPPSTPPPCTRSTSPSSMTPSEPNVTRSGRILQPRASSPPSQSTESTTRVNAVARDAHSHENAQMEDSFARLVTLRIELDKVDQSYADLGDPLPHMKKKADVTRDRCMPTDCVHVTYHDVDGVLDFLMLRHVFDAAIARDWKPGDHFICPLGSVWCRGQFVRLIHPASAQASHPPVILQPVPSCSHHVPIVTAPSSLPSSSSMRPDPWLNCLVRWLPPFEQNPNPSASRLDPLEGTSEERMGEEGADDGALETTERAVEMDDSVKLDGTSQLEDRLSPWDMHRWVSEDVETDTSTVRLEDNTLKGRVDSDGLVHVPLSQLRRLYGDWHACRGEKPVDETELLHRIQQISELPISILFNEPVDLTAYPDYVFVNPCLIDLGLIRARLQNGFYRQTSAIHADLQLLLDNTVRYNCPESEIVDHARIIFQLASLSVTKSVLNITTEYQRLSNQSVPHNTPLTPPDAPVISPQHPVPNTTTTTAPPSLSPHQSMNSYSLRQVRPRKPHGDVEYDYNSGNTHTTSTSGSGGGGGSGTDDLPRSRSKNSARSLRAQRRSEHGCTLSPTTNTPNQCLAGCVAQSAQLSTRWLPTARALFRQLMTHPFSMFFRDPIDTTLYTDYLRIVPEPLDLSTVRSRLIQIKPSISNGRRGMLQRPRSAPMNRQPYQCPHELHADLERIVTNSRLYNVDPETAVFDDTSRLERWITRVFWPKLTTALERGASATRPQFRQSKLACRKFALRRLRLQQRQQHQKRNGGGRRKKKRATEGLAPRTLRTSNGPSNTESPDVPHRTSSGRVVRPPKRDALVVELPSTSDSEIDWESEDRHSKLPQQQRRRRRGGGSLVVPTADARATTTTTITTTTNSSPNGIERLVVKSPSSVCGSSGTSSNNATIGRPTSPSDLEPLRRRSKRQRTSRHVYLPDDDFD